MTSLTQWWKKQEKLLWSIGLAIVGLGITALGGYLFNWTWTGFNASIGPQLQQYQPAKTFWDWLQLLVIPVGLAIFAFWFNGKEQKATEQRAKVESDRALEFQRQAVLQEYIDRISELLLEKDLGEDKPNHKVLTVARARTITALLVLDANRKSSLFEFLYTAGLIRVIYLDEANWSGANLSGANLRGVKMRRANLSGANLRGINLNEAELMGANLNGADLRRADLVSANLTGADLTGADLSASNISHTNLTGAIYTEEQVEKAQWRDNLVL